MKSGEEAPLTDEELRELTEFVGSLFTGIVETQFKEVELKRPK